jgi:hypothetical protein
MPAVVPADVSAPPANALPHDDDALRSITDFLDLAEVLSFSRTTTRNNAFVRAAIPQVQFAREEHRLLMERYHAANLRDKLAILMTLASGASVIGGAIATSIYTIVRANGWDYSGAGAAGDAAIALDAAVPLTLALSLAARRSASRMRQSEWVPANPREALEQARLRFSLDRDTYRQELEATRALATRPPWREDVEGGEVESPDLHP